MLESTMMIWVGEGLRRLEKAGEGMKVSDSSVLVIVGTYRFGAGYRKRNSGSRISVAQWPSCTWLGSMCRMEVIKSR